MTPWVGARVVLLTLDANLDPTVMARVLDWLDRGWAVYASFIPQAPPLYRHHEGMPLITAVPHHQNTGGYACGYPGLTGIEVGGFYASDLALVSASHTAFPHYYLRDGAQLVRLWRTACGLHDGLRGLHALRLHRQGRLR